MVVSRSISLGVRFRTVNDASLHLWILKYILSEDVIVIVKRYILDRKL